MYEDFNNEAAELIEGMFPLKEEKVQEWIFTFGTDHIWPLTSTSLLKQYVILRGTEEGARKEMCRRFEQRWSNQYPSKEKAGVDRYELAELQLEHFDREYYT